ncbi:hypothetical protein [Rhodoplanes roseus]|uniref:Lipocalin-like domain-containing protein n=1 Tax=Rhodoplanes roseus TaxID=29409 RepID=A0A327KI36_9BRAD|nr:hypothetical protein [Rhodoplanes roseus]RAI36982.1 hypothetical protein CH341_29975 [Rhodoplanes roseus]
MTETGKLASMSALLLALVAGTGGGAAAAETNGLIGRWSIVEAVPGPWVRSKERNALNEHGRRLVDTEIVFEAGAIVSKNQGLACKRAMYQTGTYPTDALFRGSLPDGSQDRIARELGLTRSSGDVPSVDVDCGGGHFTYHLRDRNTALFAWDDVIYTLKRR